MGRWVHFLEEPPLPRLGDTRHGSPELGVAVLAAEAGVVEDKFIRHQPLHGIDGLLAGSAHLLHLRLQAEGLGKGRAKGKRVRKGVWRSGAHLTVQPPSPSSLLPFAGAPVSLKQPTVVSTDAGLDWCSDFRFPSSPPRHEAEERSKAVGTLERCTVLPPELFFAS